MQYDEPLCPFEFIDPLGTPSPTASVAPSASISPSFVAPCNPFSDNDCFSTVRCRSDPAQGTQTLYINIFAPSESINGRVECELPSEFTCDIPPTNPPTPFPTGSSPTGAPSSSNATMVPTSAPTPKDDGGGILETILGILFWPFIAIWNLITSIFS